MKVYKRKDSYNPKAYHVYFASDATKSLNELVEPYFMVFADERTKAIIINKPANWTIKCYDFKEFA